MGGKNEGISGSKINLVQRWLQSGSLSPIFYCNVRVLTESVTDVVKDNASS